MIDLRCAFFVVTRGKPSIRSKRIWYPKTLRVPVPVRSVLGVPCVYTWRMKSSYWERTGRVMAAIMASLDANHAAGIHDVLRVQRLLDRTHHLQGHRVLVVRQLVDLEAADAVLRADRSAELRHGVVHDPVHLRFPLAQESRRVSALRRLHVVVQVAVT